MYILFNVNKHGGIFYGNFSDQNMILHCNDYLSI